MTIEVDDSTPIDLFPVAKSGRLIGLSRAAVMNFEPLGLKLFKFGRNVWASRKELEQLIKDNPLRLTPEQVALDEALQNQNQSKTMSAKENLTNYTNHLKKYKKEQDEKITSMTAPRPCDYSLTTEAELWCCRKMQIEIFGKLLENK